MSEISCNIVKDLMPLYIDGIVSAETEKEIQEHIEKCDCCQEEYRKLKQNIVLPISKDIQKEDRKILKNFKYKLKMKKIMISCISIFITTLVIFIGYMTYQNISTVHDYFSPIMMVSLHEGIINNWEQVHIDNKDYLEFDSVFYSKKVVSDANSEGNVEMRISDTDGKVIYEKLTIEPGKEISLKQLERNVKYIIEVKTDTNFALLRFF